jgi:hypothetical protein
MSAGTVIFRDESGNEGTYTFPCAHDGDKLVEVITRAEVRLGIYEETHEQRAHWLKVRAAAAARAPRIEAPYHGTMKSNNGGNNDPRHHHAD